jgi:subtilisin-like proprotein convertase family protein
MSGSSRRWATVVLALAVVIVALGLGAPAAFAMTARTNSDTQVEIPDEGTVDSTVNVAGVSGPIQKVTVSLYMWGGRDSDHGIVLVAPDGTEVELSTNNGGAGETYGTGTADASRTIFDDSAATSITAASAPFVGTFKPEGSLAALIGKFGSSANGTWKLRLTDSVNGWEGALYCWSLMIQTGTRFDSIALPEMPTSAGSVYSPVNVSGVSGTIRKVTVSLRASLWDGQFHHVYLIAPDGTEVALSIDNGNPTGVTYFGDWTADDSRTIFDDGAATSITEATSPFVGPFRPEGSLAALIGKSGSAVNGTWHLRVSRDIPGEQGYLYGWALFIDDGQTRADDAVERAIPDEGTLDAAVSVSGLTKRIKKVRVSLYLTHGYDWDLVISLRGPDGTECTLSNQRGEAGDDFGAAASPDSNRTTFDDAASAPIAGGTAPFVGTFAPDSPLSTFTGKAGAQANGVWTLRVQDRYPGFAGTLHAWSLHIDQDELPPVTTLTAAPATPALNGWYTSAPTITLTRDEAGTSFYRWETAGTPTTYTVPFQAIEGSHTLTYFSADTSNNTETARSATFRVDTAHPTVDSLTSPTHSNENTWYPDDDPRFDWSASDAVSGTGVTGYSHSFDQIPTSSPDTASEGMTTTFVATDTPDGEWYFHVSAGDGAGNWSAPSHRRVRIDRTPGFSLTVNKSKVAYNSPVVLTGSLATSAGPVPDSVVTLWRRTSPTATWQADGTTTCNALTATYTATRTLQRNTYFEMRFAGDATYTAHASPPILVQATCWMSRPAMKAVVARGSLFTVTGLLKPRHSGKTKLFFYRRIGTRWLKYRTVYATNRNYLSYYTKYTLGCRLLPTGRWYVVPYHCDGDHGAAYGPKWYFQVR